MKGLVTITKVFKDGTREPVLKEGYNVLTDGFGISVVSLMSASPQEMAERFQFGYFQVGTSGYYQHLPRVSVANKKEDWAYALPLATHNNFYELSSALTSVESYGLDGDIELIEKECLIATNPFEPQEDLVYTTKNLLLAKLPDHPTTNITDQAVHTKITIDRESLNGVSIGEIGLFAKNPEGKFRGRPVLAAYKSIPDKIEKTSEFSLDIEWVIRLNPYPTRAQDYYDVWDLQKLGDTLRFHPGVKPEGNHFYVATMENGDTYDIVVESTTPTPKDGFLSYSLEGDAVSGVHYSIDSAYASPLFVPKGTTKITIPVSSITTSTYSNSSTRLEINLDSFTGGKRIPNTLLDGTPPFFILFFRNRNTPPVVEVYVNNSESPPEVSGILDASCMNDVTVYLEFSSDGGVRARDPIYDSVLVSTLDAGVCCVPLTISSGATEAKLQFEQTPGAATTATFVEVSSYNISAGASEINKFAHSNNFQPELQPSAFISIQDINDHISDLIEPQSAWWRTNVGHSKIYHPGYPTIKTHSGNDTFTTGPTQHMYLHSYVLPDIKAPDGIQEATLSYAPSSIYMWPEVNTYADYYETNGIPRSVDSCPKIRKSYTTYEFDSLNRSIEREQQLQEYDSTMSSVVLSMYVRRLNGTKSVPHPNIQETSNVSSNDYVQLRFFTRGFKEVGNTIIPGSQQKSVTANFQWNSDGGIDAIYSEAQSGSAWALENMYVSAGVFSGTSDDVTKYGYQDPWAGRDGWYRIWITAEIPVALTELATDADLNWDGSGAVSQWFIFPTCETSDITAETNLPGYTIDTSSAPLTLSGTVHCWAQYEETLKSETHDRRVPRPYQPREFDFFEPIGNTNLSNDPTKQKVTVTF